MKTIKLISVFILFHQLTYAQVLEYNNEKDFMFQINDKNEIFIYYLANINKTYSDQFTFFKEILNISDFNNFELYEKGKDHLGSIYYHYHQYYKGIPVENGEFVLHFSEGIIKSANGNFIRVMDLDTEPTINKDEAVKFWCDYLKYGYKDEYMNEVNLELIIVDLNKNNKDILST